MSFLNRRIDPDAFFRRLMLVPRGLGFVVIVYFVSVVLRDLLGQALPGHGLVGALRGDEAGPWIPLVISVGTLAIPVLFVRLYARTGPEANVPRPLLACTPRAAVEWGLGFLVGGACAAVAVLPLLLAGAIEVTGGGGGLVRPPWTTLAVVLILFAEAAREELGFRGPAQRDLARATREPIAAVFLAGSFALIHRANPAIGPWALAGIFAAGVALAGVVRARGDLWMACGIHTGWNICLGLVWSVPVSGHPLANAAFETKVHESLWTGGAFGPEAAPTGLAAFVLLGVLAWSRPRAAARS